MRSVTAVFLLVLLGFGGSAQAQEGAPAGPVPPQLLQHRRELLLGRIADGVVILRSARVHDMEGEDFPQATDFRQDDDFFYLTGLETPDSWLVLVAHHNTPDRITLYIPPRNEAEEQWTGTRLDASAAAAQAGVTDVRTNDHFAGDMGALIKSGVSLYTKLPGDAELLCAQLDEPRRSDCQWLFLQPLKRSAGVSLADIHQHIGELRLIKDDDELRRMRRAIDITTDALRIAMRTAKPGMWEYQIEATIEEVFHAAGAERVGFPTIVGSGPNSTVLHYDKSRRQTQPGDLVVMDIGAEYGYYTADVTRTMPISGKFTDRQRALYDIVLGAQQAVMDSVRPGTTIPRLDEIARAYMRTHSHGLCGPQSCDEFFVHGLSHWLGMDVHDPAALDQPLAAGMVLTVEPGVYLRNEGIGIRIEDDVLVTANGYELLSKGAPRRAEDVEKMMLER